WGDVAPLEPPPAPEQPAPVPDSSQHQEVPAPPMLHFDALAAADVARSPKPTGRRPALPPMRRHRRQARAGLRRIAIGALTLALPAAATIGGLLVSRDHPAPARSPHPPVARAASPTTPVPTPPAPTRPV